MEQENVYQNFLEKLQKNLNILPDKNEENADNTLTALWHTAAGNRVSAIASTQLKLPLLSTAQITILDEFINSRLSGVPLAHLTERQDFMGLDYILNRGHYIPRKETELLAKTAIDTIAANFASAPNIAVIDLCTGIGTVALAIAHGPRNRTGAFRPDLQQATAIDRGDRAAAGADGGDLHHRGADDQAEIDRGLGGECGSAAGDDRDVE